jgi:hypothetical protein
MRQNKNAMGNTRFIKKEDRLVFSFGCNFDKIIWSAAYFAIVTPKLNSCIKLSSESVEVDLSENIRLLERVSEKTAYRKPGTRSSPELNISRKLIFLFKDYLNFFYIIKWR